MGIKPRDFTILYVGRVAKEKNIEFLIENFKAVSKKIPRAKMYIVGDGPDMKDLIELTSYNKLDSKIIFVGKVPWDDVPKYYSLCDSFVTASTSETQGLTVIEAMAASKPVVAIKDESFELVIESGKDGILFENEEEYKEALFKLYKDKEFCNSIKQNARKKANLYSAEVYAKSVFEIYEKLMNKDTNIIKKTIHNVKHVFEKSGGKK